MIAAQREEIMTLNEIRQQLKTIRLYYMHKAKFDAAFEILPHKVADLVNEYAAMIAEAPLDLYMIYCKLYVDGLTQEATAEELKYCPEYIRQKNRRLLLFFQKNLNEREVGWLKEIEVKDNPLGIRVYAVGELDIDHMTEEEYTVFTSSLALYVNDYVAKQTKEEKNAI